MSQAQSSLIAKSPVKNNHRWIRFGIATIIAIWWGNGEHYYPALCTFCSCIGLGLVCHIFLSAYWQRGKYIWISIYFLSFWIAYLEPFAGAEQTKHIYRILPSEYEKNVAVISLLSMLATYIGYTFSFSKFPPHPFFDKEKIPVKTLGNLCYWVLALYIIRTLIGEYNMGFCGLVSSLSTNVPGLFLALTTLFYCRGGHSVGLAICTILGGFVMLLEALARLLFIKVILLLGPAILVLVLEKKYKTAFAALFLAFSLLLPAYLSRGDMRKIYWGGKTDYNDDFLCNRLQFGMDILSKNATPTTSNTQKQSQAAKSRNELITYFGQAIIYHEKLRHPYRWGETFYWLPIVWIPRAIFPWKPVNVMATTMAVEYGCSGGGRVSMNFPAIVEFYINFGFWGIVPLSLLLGIGMRYCVEKCGCGEGDWNLACLLLILLPLSRVEGNITLIYGEIINLLIVFWLLSVFLRKKAATNQPDKNLDI